MEKDCTVRAAAPRDAEALLRIYAPYVEKTAITFEYEVPSIQEFAGRIERTLERYPYLVAEADGVPVGYAYAGPFKTRAAYDWAVETTVYADGGMIGLGGLGNFVYQGVSSNNNTLIIAGAIPAAVLAIVIGALIDLLQRKVTPRGMKKEVGR